MRKGFPDFACRELNSAQFEGGCGVERRLGLLVIKVDAKRLALEEGVHEDEPELFSRCGKDEWKKFCETTLAKGPQGARSCLT